MEIKWYSDNCDENLRCVERVTFICKLTKRPYWTHTFAGIYNPFSVEKHEEEEKMARNETNHSRQTVEHNLDRWRSWRKKRRRAETEGDRLIGYTRILSHISLHFRQGRNIMSAKWPFFPLFLLTAVVHSCRLRVQGTQHTHIPNEKWEIN